MRAWANGLVSMCLAALLSASCASTNTPCSGTDCPIVSGTYEIKEITTTGSCLFAPYLVPAALVLTQSADGETATTLVVDPTQNSPMLLTTLVNLPTGTTSGNLALLTSEASTVRQAGGGSTELVNLQITLTASITRASSNLAITGALTTSTRGGLTDAGDGYCETILNFTGQTVTGQAP